MASDEYKTLFAQVFLASAAATLATVGGGKNWIVGRITVVNTDTVDRTFTLYKNGTTAQYQVTPAILVKANGGMAEVDELDSFAAGETIAGKADVPSKLTIMMSGDEVTL
jgi:hypothetical protein